MNLRIIHHLEALYTFATASSTAALTFSTSHPGEKLSRTICTPPIACFPLSSARMAPCVDVAGTVQYASPLSCPNDTHGLNSSGA
eukprot:30809-Pelagococcus_subviridis.AAC.12